MLLPFSSTNSGPDPFEPSLTAALRTNFISSYTAGRSPSAHGRVIKKYDDELKCESTHLFSSGELCFNATVRDTWTEGYPSLGTVYIYIGAVGQKHAIRVWGMNYTARFTNIAGITREQAAQFLADAIAATEAPPDDGPDTIRLQPAGPPLRGLDGYQRHIIGATGIPTNYLLQYAITFESASHTFDSLSFKETITAYGKEDGDDAVFQKLGTVFTYNAAGFYRNRNPQS